MISADIVGSSEDVERPAPGLAVNISLFTGMVSAAIIYDALPPILPSLSAHFGGGERGDLIAQLAMTIPLLGMAVSGLVAGISIEKFGIRRVLIAAILCFALAGSAGALINAAAPLLTLRFLTGLASGTLITCGTSLIAGHFAGTAQLRMTGRLFAVGAICSMSFVLVAGLLATISWRTPFLLHCFLAMIFLVPVLYLKRNSNEVKFGISKNDPYGSIQLLKPAFKAYAYIFLLNFVSYLFSVEFVFLLSSVGVKSPVIIANVIMMYAAACLAGNIIVTRVDARVGIINTIILGLVLIALAFLICASAPSFWLLAMGPIIGGLGTGLSIPSTISLIMRSVPVALAARALGFGTAMMYLGGGSAPLLLAPVRSALGLRGVYYSSVALILIAIVPLILSVLKVRRQDKASFTAVAEDF